MGIELRYMIFYAKPSPVTNPLVYSIDVLNHTSLKFSIVGKPSHFIYDWHCCLPSPLQSTSPFELCVPCRGTLPFVTLRPHF